jgi:hypothetical protein
VSDIIKGAIIIAVGIVTAMGLYLYYSPYQSCVRAQTVIFEKMYEKPAEAARVNCSHP